MAESIDKIADSFCSNRTEEEKEIRTEINDIKKDVSEAKKYVNDIKSLLMKVINK